MAPVVHSGHCIDAGEPFQRVGPPRQFADVAVGQEPAAVGQRLAAELQHLAVEKPDAQRAFLAGVNEIDLFGEVVAEQIMRYGGSGHAAALVEEGGKVQSAFGHRIRNPPEATEGAIDELNPAFLIEQNNSDAQIVDDRAQGGKLRRHFGHAGAGLIAASR